MATMNNSSRSTWAGKFDVFDEDQAIAFVDEHPTRRRFGSPWTKNRRMVAVVIVLVWII